MRRKSRYLFCVAMCLFLTSSAYAQKEEYLPTEQIESVENQNGISATVCTSGKNVTRSLKNTGNGNDLQYSRVNERFPKKHMRIIMEGQGTDIQENDIKLSDIEFPENVNAGEDIKISGSVTNVRQKPVTSYVLRWTNGDGTTGTYEKTTNLESGKQESFTFKIPGIKNAQLNNFNLKAEKVNGVSDIYDDNSTVDFDVITLYQGMAYQRTMVVEKRTGTWCGWCPRGIVAFEVMEEKYPDSFIGIAMHTSDAMAVSGNYSSILKDLTSAPSCKIDRDTYYESAISPGRLEYAWKREVAECNADIKATRTENEDGTIKVSTVTRFAYDFNAPRYRIAYVVLEDKVGPYTQSNYYAGGGNGKMGGWEDKPESVSMIYNDVARDIQPSAYGQQESVPSQIVAGERYNHVYNLTLPKSVDKKENVRIVTLLINIKTGIIENAAEALEESTGIDSVTTEEGNIFYYDLSGKRVNASELHKGIYIKRNGSNTSKIIVR